MSAIVNAGGRKITVDLPHFISTSGIAGCPVLLGPVACRFQHRRNGSRIPD